MHAVESMVINWAHLIQKVLREDSAELIFKGLNPGPNAELDFWRSRKNNIENLHEQVLCSYEHLDIFYSCNSLVIMQLISVAISVLFLASESGYSEDGENPGSGRQQLLSIF